MTLLLKPSEWEQATGIEIIDPDGWTATMLDWETPIAKEDFLNRAANSTAQYPPHFFDQFR